MANWTEVIGKRILIRRYRGFDNKLIEEILKEISPEGRLRFKSLGWQYRDDWELVEVLEDKVADTKIHGEIEMEDKKLQRKLDKEMPPIKFKKLKDPFKSKKGWSVPYERAKELLGED